MILNMYTIYDKKSETYQKPFYFLNDEIARRGAAQLIEDQNSEIAANPHDFTMFRVGTFDDSTSELKQEHDLEVVCRFHEFTAPKTATAEQIDVLIKLLQKDTK